MSDLTDYINKLEDKIDVLESKNSKLRAKNTIPVMLDPLGRHWDQPDPENILIDDTHALMSQSSFDQLANYSASQPSGVYDGKMWKSYFPLEDCWFLKWFGPCDSPNCCATNIREILIMK